MTEAGREGRFKSWKVVSTDGDFMTTSRTFIAVPGMRLTFELAAAGMVMITLSVVVYARPACRFGLRTDGLRTFTIAPQPAGDLVPAALETPETLSAGVHTIEMVMAMEGGGPGGAGPKDWSPRRRFPGGARLVRSPAVPATLLVVTA